MHAGQLTVSAEAVRELVASQFPQWRALPVHQVASQGTVNAIFRIGADLTARFPLLPGDVEPTRRWLEQEAAAARQLMGRTPFDTPEPIAIGEPGTGYPLPWSVQTWLRGTVATERNCSDSVPFAQDLARFVQAVRAIGTQGATFAGTNRGGDLQSHDAWMETCFQRSENQLDVTWLRSTWHELRHLPRLDDDVMTHGDLVPGNLLVADGRLTGILDVGGLGPADPALDLVAAWHLLESVPRQRFREDLECSDLEWARGTAWAFEQAVGLVWYYADTNPTMSDMGRCTLSRIRDPDGRLRPRRAT